MIKLASILQEIGDATNPVPYTKTSEKTDKYETRIKYEFNIGEDTYIVSVFVSDLDITLPSNEGQPKGSTGMAVMFGLKTDKYAAGVGDTTRTNRGVQYKVMATVTKIIKDYADKHPELVEISYEPVKKDKSDQGRQKLYRAYVTKALPNWKYREDDYGYVYLTKPPEEKKSLLKRIFK
jgi:hypothetical protein